LVNRLGRCAANLITRKSSPCKKWGQIAGQSYPGLSVAIFRCIFSRWAVRSISAWPSRAALTVQLCARIEKLHSYFPRPAQPSKPPTHHHQHHMQICLYTSKEQAKEQGVT